MAERLYTSREIPIGLYSECGSCPTTWISQSPAMPLPITTTLPMEL
jgi:hypothetical protein